MLFHALPGEFRTAWIKFAVTVRVARFKPAMIRGQGFLVQIYYFE